MANDTQHSHSVRWDVFPREDDDHNGDMMFNIAHASDSLESAEAELKRFFKPGEIFRY